MQAILPDIFHLIEADHESLAARVLKFRMTVDKTLKEDILDDLEHQLEVHLSTEEEVVYPRLQDHLSTDDLTSCFFDEHYEIREAVEYLRSVLKDADATQSAVTGLEELLRHHFKQEQKEGFEQMRQLLSPSDLELMRREFIEIKQDLQRTAAA